MAAWLAGRSIDSLSELLFRRNQLFTGQRSNNFHDVAHVLQGQWSLGSVLPLLSLPDLQVIEAHAALGGSVPISSLAGLLADSGDPERRRSQVVRVLARLAEYGVAWSDDGVVSHLADGFDTLIPSPLGLGPSVETNLTRMSADDMKKRLRHLSLPRTGNRAALEATLRDFYLDTDHIRAEVADAPPEIRAEFISRAYETQPKRTGHDAVRYRIEQETQSWAIARGFLRRSDDYALVIPAQVQLALRGNDFCAPFDPLPPKVPVTTGSQQRINGEAGSAALDFLGSTTIVLDHLARQPAATLKYGGLGVREISKLAKISRSSETRIRLILALARNLGLITEKNSRATVSETYLAWGGADPAARIAQLAVTWWWLGNIPTLDWKENSHVSPLVQSVAAHQDDRDLRRATLQAITELGTEKFIVDLDALATWINWNHPVLVAGRSDAVRAILAEAQQLGVLGGTACGPMAHALAPFDEAALHAAASATLPPIATKATFGSDLTVLVSGSPASHIGSLLDSCGDRESGGNATVWRLSPSSVRRALDGGRSASDLLSALADVADGPLPQPLTYLVNDVGRRHGVVTVLDAVSCLRSKDASLLREMCSDRSLKRLGLQLIAPTVAISGLSKADALAALRAAGYLPAAEGVTSDVAARESGAIPIDPALVRRDGVGVAGQLPWQSGRSKDRKPSEMARRRRARTMAEQLKDGRPAIW